MRLKVHAPPVVSTDAAPASIARWARGLVGVGLVAFTVSATLAATSVLDSPGSIVASNPRSPFLSAAQKFAGTCAGCHGSLAGGGPAPRLFDSHRLTERSDEQLLHTIQDGVASGGMPSFRGQISEQETYQLIAYLRAQAEALRDKPAYVADPRSKIVHSAKQAFRIEVIAAGLDTPWGLAFLPDGRMLVTERGGHLRIIDHGKLDPKPVIGTPTVFVRQDGGLLDVAVDPDYRRNGWVYLSYSEAAPGPIPVPATPPVPGAPPPSPRTMTVLIRGKIDPAHRWVQSHDLFRAPDSLYTVSGSHYGSRFLFDRSGHLFYSLGERGEMKNAQDLTTPLGKIHRINTNGSVPADNPFIHTPGAVPTIWSYGHRNPQGLAFDPVTGNLWESEHGPTGGDEINIIERGKNYGWGVISMGIQPGITKRSQAGMEQPIAFYTPTIAPSGISFYTGNRYPRWKNNLFVAALAGQQLRRLEIRGRTIVSQEVVFEQLGRTRAVATGPDGLLYILLQNPTGSGTGHKLSEDTPGMVIRLDPL